LSPWIKALALTLTLNGAAFAATAEKAEPAKADKPAPAKSETAKTENAKADENRKKPLQRCDELKDKAQLECLKKAREQVLQARAKREAKGEKK
jgi:hypothetical protein